MNEILKLYGRPVSECTWVRIPDRQTRFFPFLNQITGKSKKYLKKQKGGKIGLQESKRGLEHYLGCLVLSSSLITVD